MALQIISMIEGTNHVVTLSTDMGNDADTVLAVVDNWNTGLAFKYIHDHVKDGKRDQKYLTSGSFIFRSPCR